MLDANPETEKMRDTPAESLKVNCKWNTYLQEWIDSHRHNLEKDIEKLVAVDVPDLDYGNIKPCFYNNTGSTIDIDLPLIPTLMDSIENQMKAYPQWKFDTKKTRREAGLDGEYAFPWLNYSNGAEWYADRIYLRFCFMPADANSTCERVLIKEEKEVRETVRRKFTYQCKNGESALEPEVANDAA